MNIVYYLLKKFFNEEWTNTILMIFTSFIINILQTNGISLITANIIGSLQKNNEKMAYSFYKYFIVVVIIYTILHYIYKNFQTTLLTKLRQWIRFQLVRMIILVNNENYSDSNFAKLGSPINRLSSTCFMVFNDIVTFLLPNISFLLIIAAYFLYKNALFGGGFILGNAILILYLVYNWSDMKIHNDEYEKQITDNEAYLVEILNNMDKIIYRGQTTGEINTFSEKKDQSIQKAREFYGRTDYHCATLSVMVFSIIFLCIGYLIHLFFAKQISLTIFITFFTIILLYRDKMSTLIQQIPDYIEFMGRTESVLTHFQDIGSDYEKLDITQYGIVDLPFEHIEFDGVAFQYGGADTTVFQDLNLSLKTNDHKIIGITGLSGRGKSTFMKMVLKMHKCKEGAIYVDGHDIAGVDGDYIRENITYVNQNSKLFDRKIIENIMYGCSDVDACKAHYDEIIQYPKIRELYRNVDIEEGRAGSLGEKLSGGQRQVVNLIGGLINPSKILILDEPTNALDPDLKKEILELIGKFRKHKQCILIITHDQDVHPLFDEEIKI